jgi:predicted nucleic acid-binding protein
MNLFVDTSVWSLALRRDTPSAGAEVSCLSEALEGGAQVTDHVEAASLRNQCRKRGLHVATIDALLAQLCIRRELVMLTTDKDFDAIAELHPLRLRK